MHQSTRAFRAALLSCAALVCLLAFPSSAAAQATRTWVSGVGDDVNPCSRTAPCKTFAGAISKTAVGGEIDALDPGSFGAVTITKDITIDGGGFAGILASATNGITINPTAPNAIVRLRNLSIDGAGTGLRGIRFLAGAKLIVEKCVIFNFNGSPGYGIDVERTAGGEIQLSDVIVSDTTIAFRMNTTAGLLNASIDNSRLLASQTGLDPLTGRVTISNSIISGNVNFGMIAEGTAVISSESNIVDYNNTGVAAAGGSATVVLSNTDIFRNNTGIGSLGGAVISFGNNHNHGNTTPGTPTSTVLLQ